MPVAALDVGLASVILVAKTLLALLAILVSAILCHEGFLFLSLCFFVLFLVRGMGLQKNCNRSSLQA